MNYPRNVDTQLSKRLSWLLRHGAIKEGLPIASNGFVPVEFVLDHISFRGRYTAEDIMRVVESDSKNRYTVTICPKTKRMLIKANQGHSMNEVSELNLTKLKLGSEIPLVVHVSDKLMSGKERASGIRHNCEVLIYINTELALRSGIEFFRSENNVILSPGINGLIKPEFFLKVVDRRSGISIEATLMDESHENSLNASKYPGKDESHKCKFCGQKFDNLQLVLKHELLSHTLEKAPRKSPANQLKRKVSAVLKTINGEDEKKSRQELVEAISDCAEGFELHVIFNKYQINNENLMCIYSRVHTCLEDELNRIGEFSIETFGSVSNGLALKTSDIDLHVSNKVHQVRSNIVFRDVTRILYRSKCFTNVFPIRKARVPIIKCVHRATGFNLDINTSEPFGVYNSKFIRQLVECDHRIHQLMLFLKIWCKNMHINGTFNMTNYCLIALIIFFLQNSNPPILDSIKILQRNAPKRFIRGVNFEVNLRGIPLDSSKSIHELIKGFFHFYQSFNFDKYIIAPYLGKTIKREDFNNKTFIYPEYESQILSLAKDGEIEMLRTDRPVCIQDAFCLNINVGKCLTETNVQYFKKCVNLAYKKCSEPLILRKNLYKYLLVNLIDDVTNIDHEIEIDPPKSEISMSFDIIPRRTELKSLSKFESDPLLLQKLWVKEYVDAIVQIVTEVYRIDMTLLSSTQSIKFKKVDENDKGAASLPTKWCISCYVDLWSGRQIHRTNTTPFIEYHLEQTKKLNAERRQDSKFAVQLKGYLTLSTIKNYSALRVEVSSEDTICKKDKLRRFFNALKCIMQNYNLKQRIYQLETDRQTKE